MVVRWCEEVMRVGIWKIYISGRSYKDADEGDNPESTDLSVNSPAPAFI